MTWLLFIGLYLYAGVFPTLGFIRESTEEGGVPSVWECLLVLTVMWPITTFVSICGFVTGYCSAKAEILRERKL